MMFMFVSYLWFPEHRLRMRIASLFPGTCVEERISTDRRTSDHNIICPSSQGEEERVERDRIAGLRASKERRFD